jgi:hypothetical protein
VRLLKSQLIAGILRTRGEQNHNGDWATQPSVLRREEDDAVVPET